MAIPPPPPDASLSEVTGYYSIARHSDNKLGNFAMCDGSAISARTNAFWRTQGEANDAATEWDQARVSVLVPVADDSQLMLQ